TGRIGIAIGSARLGLRPLGRAPLVGAPEAADEGPGGRADGRALARIAADGTAHRTDRRAARRRSGHLTRRAGGWRGHGGGIHAGLLGRPDMAFALVLLLLLRALPARRVH